MLVERKIAAEFLELLIAEIPKLKIGDPLSDDTEYGPLISGAHRERVHAIVADAIANGATLLAGGKMPAEPGTGYYYLPTILDGVDAKSRAATDEIFGPVLTVERFDDEEQAIASANGSRYGLAAYVWTSRTDRALRVAERAQNRDGVGQQFLSARSADSVRRREDERARAARRPLQHGVLDRAETCLYRLRQRREHDG